VGDVVGTGSSRKSAINSVQWYMGQDIPHVPNKRTAGIVLGSKIAADLLQYRRGFRGAADPVATFPP